MIFSAFKNGRLLIYSVNKFGNLKVQCNELTSVPLSRLTRLITFRDRLKRVLYVCVSTRQRKHNDELICIIYKAAQKPAGEQNKLR